MGGAMRRMLNRKLSQWFEQCQYVCVCACADLAPSIDASTRVVDVVGVDALGARMAWEGAKCGSRGKSTRAENLGYEQSQMCQVGLIDGFASLGCLGRGPSFALLLNEERSLSGMIASRDSCSNSMG